MKHQPGRPLREEICQLDGADEQSNEFMPWAGIDADLSTLQLIECLGGPLLQGLVVPPLDGGPSCARSMSSCRSWPWRFSLPLSASMKRLHALPRGVLRCCVASSMDMWSLSSRFSVTLSVSFSIAGSAAPSILARTSSADSPRDRRAPPAPRSLWSVMTHSFPTLVRLTAPVDVSSRKRGGFSPLGPERIAL